MTEYRLAVCFLALQLLVLVCPSAAYAHAPIEGLGTFYGYFLHPFFAPETALLVIGSALLAGQQGRQGARAGLGGVALGLAAGLVAIAVWPEMSIDPRFVLIAAALAGALLTLDQSLHVFIPFLLGLTCGAVITLDPDLAVLEGRDVWLARAGLAAGLLFFTAVVSGLSAESRLPVLLIGRRILGAWVVAAAILVLALSLKSST